MELLFALLRVLVDLEEDFLERRHRNAIAQDVQLVHVVVELLEEALEL